MCVLGAPCGALLSLPEVWPRTAEVLGAGAPALHALLHRTILAYSLSQAGKALGVVWGAVTWRGREEKLLPLAEGQKWCLELCSRCWNSLGSHSQRAELRATHT